MFDAAQSIRTSRANAAGQERTVPRNIGGQSLLSGNVFCGHCGARLALTTNGKAYPCAADPNRIVKRVWYICYGKTRKQTECDGQTGYTAHILDGMIDKIVRQIFERMRSVPKSEIINILRGESTFSKDLLSGMVAEAEAKVTGLQEQLDAAQTAYKEGQAVMDALNAQYADIISWADMYDGANLEAKKMIVNCLIKRVEVYRDYKLHIDFNIDLEQFTTSITISVA